MPSMNLLPPRIPMVDIKTGMVSKEWFVFFQQMFNRVGGSTGIGNDDLDQSQFNDAGIEESKASLFNAKDAQDSSPLMELLSQRINQLESEVSQLRAEICGKDQDVSPPAYQLSPYIVDPANVKITGGTINGVVIGGTSPLAGTFTDLRATRIGLGSAPSANNIVTVAGTAPQTGTVGRSYGNSVTIPANVTAWYIGSHSELTTAAAAFTLPELSHYKVQPPAKGAGSTITSEYGFYAVGLTRATNNYGFYSDMALASNTWNFYANGSARNFLNGNTQIGSVTSTAGDEKLQVNGTLSINSATMLRTYTSFTNGAAAATGTLTNAPVAGNPTKWIPINDNGTTRYIPSW